MNIQIEEAHQKRFFAVHGGMQCQFSAHANFKTLKTHLPLAKQFEKIPSPQNKKVLENVTMQLKEKYLYQLQL